MQKVIFLESSNFHQKNWGSNWFHFDEFVKASFQTWQVVREGVGKAVQTFIAAEVSQKKLRKVWPTELPRFYQDVLKAAFFVGHETAECAKGVPYISKAWLVGYLKCINAKAFIVTLKILGRTCWIVLIAPFEVSMLKFWTSKSFQKFHVSPNSYQFSHKSVAMREAFLHPFGSILNGQVFCHPWHSPGHVRVLLIVAILLDELLDQCPLPWYPAQLCTTMMPHFSVRQIMISS